ncbi:hypothetical protein WJ542_20210 [Paraburkholderia sp. B3]|uniref:hypothetical protein n=1 Tax=Paraburkholderia sp. B3 TaxID=3134791 RepID=UPI00398237EC
MLNGATPTTTPPGYAGTWYERADGSVIGIEAQNRQASIVTSRVYSRVLSVVLINTGNLFFAFGIFSLKRAFQMFTFDAYFWLAFGATLAGLLLGAASVHFGTRGIGLDP